MNPENARRKADALHDLLRSYGKVLIAFSGGVDSTFLLASAKNALGDCAVAVTADSVFIPVFEREEAASFCRENQIRQIVFQIDILRDPEIRRNPPDRCYFCKKRIFSRIQEIAADEGIAVIAEGSNSDDLMDYRPGMHAVTELGIRSPLCEVSLTKAEIRLLSGEMHLPTWNKPSYACLASRIPYADEISAEKLRMAEQAERFLQGMGYRQVRCRIHGKIARIEVLPEMFPDFMLHRSEISDALRSIGFQYVTLDLIGYRTGSLNEVL